MKPFNGSVQQSFLIMRPIVQALLRRTLRRSFRRVCWTGDRPEIPRNRGVILYANHNHFYDGHLIWLAARQVFSRDAIIWMQEFDRFPFFAIEGALPFPKDDPTRRAVTIRMTARRFASDAPPLLGYFPQGDLKPPESTLQDFDASTFRRFERIMARAIWVPLGIHVSWWGEDRPTALLGVGTPHENVCGDEADNIRAVLGGLRCHPPPRHDTLIDGAPSVHERWDFSFARKLFSK